MATRTQINKFITKLSLLAQHEAASRKAAGKKWVLPSMCIAQAALETGWGTSPQMKAANACFGIKWTRGCGYKAYNAATKEVYDNVTYNITAAFRAYDSLEDSVKDYFNMITTQGNFADACNQTDVEICIRAIKSGGYATDTNYVSKILSIIDSYNLTQYDSVIKEFVPIAYNRDYSYVFDAVFYSNAYEDLQKAFNYDSGALFNHFITYGMSEGRKGSQGFTVEYYKANYEDLRNAFGDNLQAYYEHYIDYGRTEGRIADKLI